MKRILFLVFGLFITGFSSFSQVRDSVRIGLPTTLGIREFTLVQVRSVTSPSIFESLTLMAVPSGRLSVFRNWIASTEAQTFSSTSKTGLALLYSTADTNFAALTNPVVSGDSIRAGLSRLAALSNRPEWNNAPILACGFAGASRFALLAGSALPARTAAIASLRAYRLEPFAGSNVASIPHLVLTGEVSGPDVRNNSGVYFSDQIRSQVLTRRAAGEQIRQAIEMNASQSTFSAKTISYLVDFLRKSIQKRIPAGSNPAAGPVSLLTIPTGNGYLGRSIEWKSFKSSNYQTSAFSGPLAPGSSQWLFDEQDASDWVNFHVSRFDSVAISPLPLPAVPYCSGQRPSALNATIRLTPGTTLAADNYFRFEISDITGNFDNPTYAARWFGTMASASQVDSIKDAVVPDNLSYMRQVPDANVKRYRMRIVSTNPYYESANFGETPISFCGPAGGIPRVYLSTVRPYKKFYNPGDSISVMVYKSPEFPYTPGNNLRIELSTKNYQFPAGQTTIMFSGVPPFTASSTLDSFLVRMKLPDTLSFGPQYRLKPFIEGVSNTIGRQTSGNGHDITVVPNQNGGEIIITTTSATTISQTGAISGGNVLFNGGLPVTARGVCWSVNPNPTTADPKTSDGTGDGAFASIISGLLPNTLYHVRAYASNANGTRYGQEVTFTTLQADQVPVLSTAVVSAITQTEAISGGDVTFDGNSAVTARGVCWSTGSLPTIDLTTKTEDGLGTGTFISNLTGLNPGTQYCVRAYAVNSTGVGYGEERCFSTASVAAVPPSVATFNISLLNACDSARGGGSVTSDGGAAVSARGVVWSTQPAPTVDLPTKSVDGSGTGAFVSFLSNLSSNTSFIVRAYATNSAGTGYGDEVTFTTCVSALSTKHRSRMLVYPNPASDAVNVASLDEPLLEIGLFTLQGSKVEIPMQIQEGIWKADLSGIASGIYILKLRTGNGTLNHRLVHP